jgi:hypothetical protein
MSKKKVIYIAGKFRGPNAWAIENNIRRAEEIALEVWKMGAVALCPHTNTRFYQGALPDEVWLGGDLELMARCDAIMLVPDWEESEGARREKWEADKLGLHIFKDLESLRAAVKLWNELKD